MLDENLPVFFYKRSPEGISHHTAIYTSYQGSDPTPAYTLKHADPASQTSRNCYAAALFDSYNPEVLYGETLVRPDWTHPTLSQEQIRLNGGVPPPPEPIRPTEFTVQLYNPDQQVVVRSKPGSWGGSTSYEFSLPQTTFRLPSASALDRTQDDPAASLNTPKLNFVWRKEGKLSKDYICYMTGRSTDQIVKKKNKEADITIALFRSLREITIYEPNLYRVDMEDPKGLEEVLLLSAATIKDVYLQSNISEIFSIQERPPRKLSNTARVNQEPALPVRRKPSPAQGGQNTTAPVVNGVPLPPRRTAVEPPASSSKPPRIPDARSQWELDAETARLRAQTEAEEKERRRRAEIQRREKEKADEAETRRLRKMVEAEEREALRRQQAIDAETERLRRQYGAPQMNNTSQRPTSSLPVPATNLRPHSSPAPPRMGSNGLYMQPNSSSYASSSMVMSGANPGAAPASSQGQRMKAKKSFWGLRSGGGDERPKTLSKKSSAMW